MLKNMTAEEFRDLLPERLRTHEPMPTDLWFRYEQEGNFTVIVAVKVDDGCPRVWTGVAKRCPNDLESNDVGLAVAASRLWREYIGREPGYGRNSRNGGAHLSPSHTRIMELLYGRHC